MTKANSLSAPALLRLQLPAFERVNLTLVGVGGTGSHIASGLVAIAQALDARGVPSDLLFIDPDIVETKNVGRQLFSTADVGQPKAAAVAGRLSAAFRMNIAAAARRIDGQDSFVVADPKTLNVVIGAVDNHAARALIAGAVARAKGRLWWLDAGNSEHAGQVSLGNRAGAAEMVGAVGLGMLGDLPAPSLLYPDLVAAPKPIKLKASKSRGRGRRAPSCAELAEAGVQGLMVNRMAAAWTLAALHDLLLGTLRWFALDFDLTYGGVRARGLDLASLSEATGLSTKELTSVVKARQGGNHQH